MMKPPPPPDGLDSLKRRRSTSQQRPTFYLYELGPVPGLQTQRVGRAAPRRGVRRSVGGGGRHALTAFGGGGNVGFGGRSAVFQDAQHDVTRGFLGLDELEPGEIGEER